jgi:hypothetical protein
MNIIKKFLENKVLCLSVVLVLSVMLNGLFFLGWLGVLLVISMIVNISFAWYIWRVIYVYKQHTLNTIALLAQVHQFTEHLEDVYHSETFYGDETLRALLDHARKMATELRNFDDAVMPEIRDEQFWQKQNRSGELGGKTEEEEV